MAELKPERDVMRGQPCDTRETADPTSKESFSVQPGDELTGTADDSLSRGFVDAARNILKGKTAEPVREWRADYEVYSMTDRAWNPYASPATSEYDCDDFITVYSRQEGTRNFRKQWRYAAGPWQDADTSAAEQEKN